MTTDTLHRATMPSPLGELTIIASDAGVRAILWEVEREGRVVIAADLQEGEHPVIAATKAQLTEYFAGDRREFTLPLDPSGTEFQQEVWNALLEIEAGATTSYGELATSIGRPKAARAIGAAVGRNPISIVVPCHRVVGANGSLTGFAGGLSAKKHLLDLESDTLF